MSELTRSEAPLKRICVLFEYLSNLYDLAVELDGRNISSYEQNDSRMTWDARRSSLVNIEKAGGILLATRAAMSGGLDLPDFTDLVLYDLPRDELSLQQLYERFNRFGRVGRLTIHALAPEAGLDPTADERLRLLHEFNRSQEG